MILENLIKGIRTVTVCGNLQKEIQSVQIDSRKAEPGCMFVAMTGVSMDGHAFIGSAIEKGATAVLCQNMPVNLTPDVTYIQVVNVEDCIGVLASAFYGNPSECFELIGVTGTNGKTTIATELFNLFRKLGYSCGLLSTVCNYIDDEAIPSTHTTPDAISLNSILARMAAAGCKYVFMECSSHAIAQKRIGGLKFAGGIFTNLTRDHLDYHKTVENYRNAKKSFFDSLSSGTFMVTNLDDPNGMFMAQNCKAKVVTYSLRSLADFKAVLLESHLDGMLLNINNCEVFLRFVGRFNASNMLAVYATAVMLKQDPMKVLTAMSELTPVSGRFETVRFKKGFTAVVDYAHTPDAVANVLAAIRDVMNGNGKLITVAGAGGNRDKGKRPMMAKEAVNNSDVVILTSDNPRFEEPQDILNDMLAGVPNNKSDKVLTIVDRAQAIRSAVMMAQKDDVILVAGKGHEDYQEIKGVKYHFDDKEILNNLNL